MECFQRGHSYAKFIETKESVYIRKEFNSPRIGLEHDMAAVLSFQDTNITAVTSCENVPYSSVFGRCSEKFQKYMYKTQIHTQKMDHSEKMTVYQSGSSCLNTINCKNTAWRVW